MPKENAFQFCRVVLAIGAFLTAAIIPARAGTFTAFGPQDYTRGTGDPITVTTNFSVLNPNTQYTLKVFNGGLQDNQTELVSSGFVTINGVQVIGPNNFNQNVTEVDVSVTLQASNTISVQVRGKPGGVLTVEIIGVDNDPPTITATASPAPNAAGWNNTNVTVTFACADATSPVTSCTAPQTVTTEGAQQVISGTAVDSAGNSASTSVTVKLDKTPPTISITSPTNGATFSSSSVAVSGSVSDALSGVSVVTCDGAPATVQSGSFSCSIILTPGANTITAQATDVAGNTSSATESVTLQNAAAPVITSFSPTSAPVGTQVTISGSNFTANGTATPQVVLSQQGSGTITAPIVSFTATSISFIIPAGAASGALTVTTSGQSGTSATSLTVVPSSSFSISANPSPVNVQQGTSASVSVSLSSSNSFSQLADLSVTGLPSGVTAKFSPVRITSGQFSILTITAPAGQTTGNSSLTISAAATVEGIPTTQSAAVSLSVQAATTSLIGRIVESDNIETPIPGIIATFLGVDDAGNKTGCTGQTRSDAAGNFAFTNLSSACLGRQLVGYDGNSATDGEKYAGVNLAYTMNAGQITGPELVHLPTITDAETIMVKQNATVDQTFSYSTIPGVVVTVYAGTTLTLPDGTKPDPFPMAAVLVPVDRLPDEPSPTPGTLRASIVAFQPADTTSNQPVSVIFPNVVNTPPGVNMELDTLDPIVGELVKYGTGTVSADASEIIPDLDPAHPGHRFGISHFDWHGPMAPAPNGNNPSPDPNSPKNGDPVDTASGLLEFTKTDIAFGGARGQISVRRTYRTLSGNPGPFGVGTNHNYGYSLDILNLIRGTGTFVNLVMPDGNQFQFVQEGANTFVNSSIPVLLGAVITSPSSGTYNLRWKDGTIYRFSSPSAFATVAFLNSITDANGNTTTLVRGNSSQPIQITQIIDPVGRALNVSYDNFNRILSMTDPIGRNVQYTYNSQGTLATFTDLAGGVTSYGYDTQNRLTSITDARKITYQQNVYDANGRVIQQTAADGGITKFAYTLLNPLVPTSPILLTTVTDPLGNQTIYHYNPQGFLLDATDALGEKTVYTRDPGTNQILSLTDPLGRMTAFTYDSFGNQTTITRLAFTPDAVTTSLTYDPTFNKLTSITDPLGHKTAMRYDSAGNLAGVIDPLSHQTTFTYDANGELLTITDPLGNKTQFAYENGSVASVTDPEGNQVSRTTDAVGRLRSITWPLGESTLYDYNPLNQITQSTNALGGTTVFTYDPNGNLLSMIDPSHNTTTWTYDTMDRVETNQDALQRQTSYTYDLGGNLLSKTDRRGLVTSLAYDPLNRLKTVNYNTAVNGGSTTRESTISFVYDAGSRMVQAADSSGGTIADAYDNLDRLATETTPQGSIAYQYDSAGRRTSMTVAGQPQVSYSYDNANRLTQITQGTSTIGLGYDNANRRTSLNLPNGVNVAYAFDKDSRITGIEYNLGTTILGNLTYSYDQVGRRTQVGGSYARTNLPPTVTSAVYDAANELTRWNGAILSYDKNGNMLSDGSNTFTWNARDQAVTINGRSVQYDARGRRIENEAGTSFLYDGLNVEQELSGTTVTASLLSGGLDEIFSRTDASGTLTPLLDALGSTIALVNSSGNLLTSYTYDPFGNTSISGTPGANEFQYTGREDDGNGLYYYRARYYNTRFGRFVSQDPMGFANGTNIYIYALNNPLNLRDPLGLSAGSAALCFLKGVGTGAVGAVAVGALAVGVAALGAPVAVVTAGLGILAIAGTAALGWNLTSNILNGNWDGVAYDVGNVVGGALAGGASGRAVAEGVNGVQSPPWSWGSDAAQHYDPNLGSIGDWLGTGPNPGSAAGSTAAGGAGAGSLAGRQCGCN